MKLPVPKCYDITTKKVVEIAEEEFEFDSPVVIVGANGSGKSKLGSWIEDNIVQDKVTRIGGQRVLSIPDSLPLKSLEHALNEVIYGNATHIGDKNGNRWGSGKTTTLLNDFASVLSLLFANEAKRDADFTKAFKESTAKNDLIIPESSTDKLMRIWNILLPHRKIALSDSKVKIEVSPTVSYLGNEMSDGERVTIYLLSHCLTAPNEHTIIIDEPESHLHRAIVSKLWDLVEGIRPDCQFIYITHDFEFATSRQSAKKIWCKEYINPSLWDWEFIEEKDNLPESLKLELLGSRKNILFTEGVLGGIDHSILSEVYPHYKIVPVASCSKVIESTKSFKSYGQLTHLQIAGIIDRDFRSVAEITSLSTGHSIFTLSVAEIENVLISEAVFRVVATQLGHDPNVKVIELTSAIITELNLHLNEQISRRTSDEILFKVGNFDRKAVGSADIEASFNTEVSGIDIANMYAVNQQLYHDAIARNNLNNILEIYNNKGLVGLGAACVGLRDKKAYSSYIIRMLNSTRRNEFLAALQMVLPTLP